MAYNVVMKGKSCALVDKHRDHDGKVKEKYLLGLGVMTDAEFKSFRSQVHELAQEDRINYCMRSKRVVEVAPDIPRTKAPTGRTPEELEPKQTVKKVRKPNKAKRIPIQERVMWETRPWLKRGYLTIQERHRMSTEAEEKESRAIKKAIQEREKTGEDMSKPLVIKPAHVPTMTKQQRDVRITKIKADIAFSKSVIAQKRKVATFTKTGRESVRDSIEYHKSVVSAGNEAIKILRQKRGK